MKTPAEMSAAQLKQFRSAIDHNVRPPQPLHGRTIVQSNIDVSASGRHLKNAMPEAFISPS